MLDSIFLSIIFVNIAKIIFLSPDILCNGFKGKKHTNLVISFFA